MSETDSFKQQWLAGDRTRHWGGNPMDMASQIQTLTQRNYELTTLVATLVDMLAEGGAVDANVLLARVEGQLENEVAAQKVVAKPTVPMTTCVRCGCDVPMSTAEMTANGLMCAPCSITNS